MFWIWLVIAFCGSSYLMKIGWNYMKPNNDPIHDLLEVLYFFLGFGGIIGTFSLVICHLTA